LSIQRALLTVDLATEADHDDDIHESDLVRKLCNIVSSMLLIYTLPIFTSCP
jgi:hypothetical protein